MLGLPPGVSPSTPHCVQCRRRIGVHLSFPDPVQVRHGVPITRRICYRCHRAAQWGRLPPLLSDVTPPSSGKPAQFVMYRLAMILVAGVTFVIVRNTGNLGHFLIGLGGVIMFFALSGAVRPRRPKPALPPRPTVDPPAHMPEE